MEEQLKNKDYISQVYSVQPIPDQYINFYYQKTPKQVSEQLKKIFLIGLTGVGKSSLANTIIGQYNSFKESSSIKSCTQETIGKYFQWPIQNLTEKNQIPLKDKQTPFLVIDSPGLCDNDGKDPQNIVKMLCYLKNIFYINTFIICFNCQDPRLDENKLSILKLFSQMFGENFFKNVIISFTRWSYNKLEIKKRTKQGLNEESLITQMQQQFQEKINVNLNKDQFIFIENSYLDPEIREDCTDEEIEKNTKQLEILFQKTLNNQAFWCHDLKEVMKENDHLKLQIQQQIQINQNVQNDLKKKQEELEEDRERAQQEILNFQKESESQQQNLKNQLEEAKKQKVVHIHHYHKSHKCQIF